jgi:opine dehydrogenase
MHAQRNEFQEVLAKLASQQTTAPAPHPSLASAAVLGAGPVGQALACELLGAGLEVALFSAYRSEVAALSDSGTITVRGKHLIGSYRVSPEPRGPQPQIRLAGGIDDAVVGADAVFVATPASAHRTYAGLLAGSLADGQLVAIVPGRCFGAVEFVQALRRNGAYPEVTTVEIASSPYLAAAPAPGQITIHAVKRSLAAAALPNRRGVAAVEALRAVLPMLTTADGVLTTSFGDHGGVLHVPPIVLSPGIVESPRAAAPALYVDAITPRMADIVMGRLDHERREVAFAYGVRDLPSVRDWLTATYGGDGGTLYEVLQSLEAYEQLELATGNAALAQLREATTASLVPVSSAGQVAGVATPATDALIDLASLITQADLRRHGRTLESLGLDGFTPDDVRRHLTDAGVAGGAVLAAETLRSLG